MNENDILIKNYLNRTFFKAWKNQAYETNPEKFGVFHELEIMINSQCDLACTYCYYTKFGEELYPNKIANKAEIKNNLKILLAWLEENEYFPRISLFSGEPFVQDLGFTVMQMVIDFYYRNDVKIDLTVPTNFNWIHSEDRTNKVKTLIQYGKLKGVNIHLSCSVDGKYCDVNRPAKNGIIRDDEFYDKMFKFVKDYKCGLHPMVYSNKIEDWIKNFGWFMENMEKYHIPLESLYLLEVRNANWTKEQLNEYYIFWKHIIESVRMIFKDIPNEDFPVFIHNHNLFNAFSMFGTSSKGIGCSIQSAVQVRLGDLTVPLCHRAMYKENHMWKFVKKDNKIVDIEALNAGLFFSMQSHDFRSSPYCETCFIKDFCTGQCLGAMYEYNADPFIPIPTVCALEHVKTKATLDALISMGLSSEYCNTISPEKEKTFKYYLKNYYKETENVI